MFQLIYLVMSTAEAKTKAEKKEDVEIDSIIDRAQHRVLWNGSVGCWETGKPFILEQAESPTKIHVSSERGSSALE